MHTSVRQESENLQDEFPGIIPACVVMRSWTQKVKQNATESENVSNSSVWLSETFFHYLNSDDDIGNGVSCMSVLNRNSLV